MYYDFYLRLVKSLETKQLESSSALLGSYYQYQNLKKVKNFLSPSCDKQVLWTWTAYATPEDCKIDNNFSIAYFEFPNYWESIPNKSAQAIREKNYTWLKEWASSSIYDLITSKLDYIELMENLYLIGDEEFFVNISYWILAWFIFDDLFEVSGENYKQYFSKQIEKLTPTGVEIVDKIFEGWHKLFDWIVPSPISNKMKYAIRSEWMLMLDAIEIERKISQRFSDENVMPDFESYLNLRTVTIALPNNIALQFLNKDDYLAQTFSKDFQDLTWIVLKIFGISNDLVSHIKNRPARMLDALIVFAGGNKIYKSHVNSLLDVHRELVCEFDRVANNSDLDPLIIQALRQYAFAVVKWSVTSPRYTGFVPTMNGTVKLSIFLSNIKN